MKKLIKSKEILRKVLFTLLIIFLFRLLVHIPVPGVDATSQVFKDFLAQNKFFNVFDIFSGGGFQRFSFVTLGLGPYINASIIMQLFSFAIPALEKLTIEEGEAGREKINMYTRLITVPMCILQSYGIYFYLNKIGIVSWLGPLDLAVFLLSMLAGTMILVWLGDLVTLYGVGNGVSLLIFVSIISAMPVSILSFVTSLMSGDLMMNLIFVALSVLTVALVVVVNEGTRNITIEYGRAGVRTNKVTNYLPIKVNQAGVIPIIFAISLVMLPSMLSGPFMQSGNQVMVSVGLFLAQNFNQTALGYNILYFALVVGFTFLYTTLSFNPSKIADDVKKRGGFIPGIRPGKNTTDYLKGIVNRVTLAGALFLGVIAILPFLVQNFLGLTAVNIGGTGLLIVVSVVLETIRQLTAMSTGKSYERFLN